MSRRANHGMNREALVAVPKTAVPDGEIAATTRPYRDRPFCRERLRDLHVGGAHEDLSNSGATAYKAAAEAEAEDLFVYYLKVASALGMVSTALFLLMVAGFSL